MTNLSVYIGTRLVGTLDSSDRRSLRFAYDTDYIGDPGATPLSVSMPLRETPYSHATVHPYLWGLMPDNERVVDRWAREFGCSASDVAGLLRGVGSDVAGAAQYVTTGAISEESEPGGVGWLTDAEVERYLRDMQRDTSAWRPHAEGRWSLAGAQPKIALLHDSTLGRWGIPHGRVPTTHILKPAISGLDDFDVNEHLCLAAARRLGMTAAETSVRWFGDQRVLVVRRYDRVSVDDVIVRVHQEDLCQALSVHPASKYEVEGGPGLVQLGKLVGDVAGRSDTFRLFDALVYNWLLLATDGHAKNFSLLLSGPQVRLAPLYDVASGLPYLHPREARMAQKIGGERRPMFIKRRHWERAATAFGINPQAAHERIVTMIDRLPDALADVARASALSVDEHKIASTIRDLVTNWLKTPRLAMSTGSNPGHVAPKPTPTSED